MSAVATRRKVVACGLIVAASLLVYAWWSHHSLARALRTIPVEPLATIMEKTGSDLVVLKQRGDLPTRETQLPDTLAAYEQNPQAFKADAKLFEAWLKASQLATSILEHGPGGSWVKSSSSFDYAKAEYKVDPWAHSFCVLRRGARILVISGGPKAPSSPVCKDVHLTEEELAKFPPMRMLQSPSGSLMMAAIDKTAPVSSRSK